MFVEKKIVLSELHEPRHSVVFVIPVCHLQDNMPVLLIIFL